MTFVHLAYLSPEDHHVQALASLVYGLEKRCCHAKQFNNKGFYL
ncbi:hypothetical protein EDC32_1011167 [Laceyella sacchari]|jgi:hypothetical protein|nr:hypothetical protein EDC32_1011167 [Laceyella sacchari]